eukprot:TRINITY_DN492_c3_g1_i1.p1 TRINITY_DN492_c3_g1~~TRINITY_DN492_c3_g1_i1.p1  ORF type:complete len:188 (+),score=60.72 TRINITY_DN492_c3_g1_i1:50-613(+)
MGYIFDPQTLQEIAIEAIKSSSSTEEIITRVEQSLATRYPGHINVNRQWIFNNAGGAMGSMIILHASITEYVIIFGTPIGTEGHTGRFLVDDYFTILAGEQWSFGEGDLERQVFKPGDQHHLRRGDAKAYKIPEYCWALEYARGWIPLMLPFGLADTLFSTLDFRNLLRTLWLYAKLTVTQLLRGKI